MQRTKGKKEVRNKGGAPDGAVLLEIENQDTKKLEARVARKENLNQLLGDPRNAERKLFPIHFAVEVGGAEIVELLAGGGADVNALDSQGSTPLVGAITADQPQEPIIDALLKHKADVNLSGPNGSPIVLAASSDNEELLEKLLDSGIHGPLDCAMHVAAKAGNYKIIQLLLLKGADFFSKDTAGFTPVMLLLLNGHNDIVSDILKDHNPGQLPGLDVQDEKKGWTALMLACEIKSSNVSSLILELGASVDVKDKVCGDSVIHQCIKRSQWGLCKDLVAKTREVDVKNNDGETSFSLAKHANAVELMEILLAKGASCGTECSNLLREAIERKQDGLAAQMIRICKPDSLKELGIDMESLFALGLGKAPAAYMEKFEEGDGLFNDTPVDGEGNTRLHDAARRGLFAFAEELIQRGLSVSKENVNGDTPLHVAAKAGHVPVCKVLIDCGADVLARNQKNRTPRSQIKLPQATKDFLLDAEEDAKEMKKQKASLLWDNKMKATQTESAFGLRVV